MAARMNNMLCLFIVHVCTVFLLPLRLTIILIHGKNLDDQVGLVANRDAREINHELVGETVTDVDARHAVALTGDLRHRDVDGVVTVAGGTLAPPAAARDSDVVGGDPIESETLVVALSHDAHFVRGSLSKVGADKPALGDLEMVLCGIGPRDACFCNKLSIIITFLNKLNVKCFQPISFLSSIHFLLALKQGQATWSTCHAYALCMSISNECECGKKSFNHSPSGLKLSEAFATIESNSSVRNFGNAVSIIGAIFRSISSGSLLEIT